MTKTAYKQRKPAKTVKAKITPLRLFSYVNEGDEHPMAKSAVAYNDDIPKVVSTRKIRMEHLKKVVPLTDTQKRMFEQYEGDYNLVCSGSAGVGKTFLAVYLALREVLSRESDYEKLVIVRSATPVKDLGFLPGNLAEKIDVYQQPYKAIFKELFPNIDSPAEKLYEQGLYEFVPTSFIRGITLHKSIIIMDEYASSTFHELDSVMTRPGNDCRIIFCGDVTQTDLQKKEDVLGVNKFMNILKHVPEFRNIEFTSDDIVRSAMVKSYIISKQRIEEEEYENQRGRGHTNKVV